MMKCDNYVTRSYRTHNKDIVVKRESVGWFVILWNHSPLDPYVSDPLTDL